MAESKPHPWFNQVLMLNKEPCESCGALCDLFEKPSSTGEDVPGGDFEIKSRGKNVILEHQDICETCLALAKAAIILRMSLYREGISDPQPLLARFWDVRVSERVINATVSWLLEGTLLTQKAITISQPKDASDCISIAAAKEDRSTARSEQNLGFIRKMLNLCETGHDCHRSCRPGGDRILPTRLVLIEDGDSSIRLYETSKNQHGSYAALSHCWGPPEKHPPRTLRGNVGSMKSEIPWNSLSAVFKESIWLCRQLGIKYIWIDSLCIVQDDHTEWEIEAAKMAQYYSEARVTIAIDSSPDGTTPFLSQRAERWHPQTSPSAPYLIVREHYDILLEGTLESTVIEAHRFLPETHHLLPTRAWAMQESILSSRIARFTLSDITWECDGETVSEDGYKGLGRSRSFYPSRPFFHVLGSPTDEDERRRAIWEFWMGIVTEFTCRSITVPTDRLPALSGMASRFQSIIGGRYLAGIWEAYLIEGLSWSRHMFGQGNIRAPDIKLAPTWSWVSICERDRVRFHQHLGISKLPFSLRPKVVKAQCETSKDSPFGQVEGGHLLIEAPLFRATLTCDRDTIPENITYEVAVVGADDNEEPWTSHELFVDCLLSVKDGNALRAYDGDDLEYLTDPASFTATAWIMWLGDGALVLGKDPHSKTFQRLGYLDSSRLGSKESESPIADPQRWTNSLKGTMVQLQLV